MGRQLDHGFHTGRHMTRPARAAAASAPCCPIIELRQYTLVPGSFEKFTTLFESRFVEGQEADGISVVGTFRVLDDPNRFFWIRGFQNMDARKAALTAFYGGDVWKAHRDAANALLVENDNVLLLHPTRTDSGFFIDPADRPAIDADDARPGLMVATIYELGTLDAETFDQEFERSIRPTVTGAGAHVVASLATERSENNFPRLPIRDDANVFAWFSCFQDEAAYDSYRTALAADPRWVKIRETFALWHMYSPPEEWRLTATPRSALRCRNAG